ncbi:hypothetical protein ACLOJK_035550 [Asimina triloba]
MEKSKPFPEYSATYSNRFDFDDERSRSYAFNGPKGKGSSGTWGPSSREKEQKRKKRVAVYNGFAMEGKIKSSVRSSYKWIKTKFSEFRNGQ